MPALAGLAAGGGGGGGLPGGDASSGDVSSTLTQMFGGITVPPLQPRSLADQLPQLVLVAGAVLVALAWLRKGR